jgi:hypothetical protein
MFERVDAFHVQTRAPIKKGSIFKNDSWYELYCFAARDGAIIFGDLIGKLDVLVSVRAVEGLAENQKS